MKMYRLILSAALYSGFFSSAMAHTETALASDAHLARHLMEAGGLCLLTLVLFSGWRIWSKSRH